MTDTYAPKNLTIDECTALGITFPSVRMDNGEYRFRCTDQNNGYGYALTKMPRDASGWQNSHYHKHIIETYIVQSGWIGFATLLADGGMQLRIHHAGDVVTTEINQSHNVYMSANTVIHTVKHGDCQTPNDWFASAKLDALTQHLTENDILNR